MSKRLNNYVVDYDFLMLIHDLGLKLRNKNKLPIIFGNSVYLDVYTLHYLISQTQFFDDTLKHVDLEQFGLLTEFSDRLYFVLHVSNTVLGGWEINNIIYNTSHKKAFLIKKVILKALKPIFSDITFNKQLSERWKSTIYNIII